MTDWQCALELNPRREVVAGSAAALCDAVRRGADLRIATDFIHNETFVGTESLAKSVMPKAPARGGKPIAKQRTNSPPATRRG